MLFCKVVTVLLAAIWLYFALVLNYFICRSFAIKSGLHQQCRQIAKKTRYECLTKRQNMGPQFAFVSPFQITLVSLRFCLSIYHVCV